VRSAEVFIEDRSTHSGPFQLPVRPATTLLELKERMAKSHGVKVECQRWILGRRLATDQQDQLTLKDYDICPSNSSLFLYVLNNNPAPAAPSKTKISSQPLPQPSPAILKLNPPGPIQQQHHIRPATATEQAGSITITRRIGTAIARKRTTTSRWKRRP